ncbi:MAG: tetratricopeptide repeat protein [Candidatus Zixiibacteriota bacterium]|nr:MAG: tetratricopeptide repeat protein [candidate division Zixibacteria bacterium]
MFFKVIVSAKNPAVSFFSRENVVKYIYALFSLWIVIIVAVTSLFPINNYDIWWHLKTGEYIVSERSIPGADIYSFTAEGNDWITHEWLAELIFYAVYSAGGFDLLIIFKVLMAALIAAILLFNFYKSDNKNPLIFILLMAAICIGSYRLFARPHLFTYLFLAALAVTIFVPSYFKRSKIVTLLFIPMLFLFWASIHSGFMIGLGVYWVIGIGAAIEDKFNKTKSRLSFYEILKKFLLPPAVASLAALINPNGVNAFTYPFLLASDPVFKSAIAEMVSPFEILATDRLYWLLLIVVIGFAVYGLIRNLKKRPTISFILLIGVISSLLSIRNAYEFAILTVAASVATMGAISRRFFSTGVLVTLIFLISFGLYTSDYIKSGRGVRLGIGGDFPQGAAAFLKEINYRGNIYAPLGWGSYLIWSGWPDLRVFIDGRLLVYGADLLNEYHYIRQNEASALERLAGRGTEAVAIPIGQMRWQIRNAIAVSPDWQLCYFDDKSVVYLMRNEHNRGWLENYGFNKIDPLAPGYVGRETQRADTAIIVEEALRAYEQSPGSVTTSAVLARAYYLNGKYTSAADYYKKAAALAPMMTDFLYQVANSYHRGGDLDSAAVWYEKAIETMPEYEQAYFEYGAIEAARGRYEKAIEIWERVLRFNPDSQAKNFIEQVEKVMNEVKSDSG